MRHSLIVTIFGIAGLSLTTSACSLLGAYANGASSMMTQPGMGMAVTPEAPGTPGHGGTSMSAGKAPAKPEGQHGGGESEAQNPSMPSTVSITLRNQCSKNAKLFFGTKPKFGSGRTTSLSSNSKTNETLRPGDLLWIVDDEDNGVASVAVETGMREIEITSSCDAFRTR